MLLMILLSAVPYLGTAQDRARVLIVYHSGEGHTKQMAEAVARGVMEVEGVKADLRTASAVTLDEVRSADAIVVGSPVHNAAVHPEIQKFINSWPIDGPMRSKIGSAFVTGGGISAGEELVQVGILHSMLIFGMIIVGGEDWTSAFGASAVTEESPFQKGQVDQRFIVKAKALGERVARMTIRLANAPQEH